MIPTVYAATFPLTVVEQTARGERAYDIYSRLLKDNIVFIGRPSTTTSPIWSSRSCCFSKRKTRRRTSTSTSTARRLHHVGMAIYDTMQFIRPTSRRSVWDRQHPWRRCSWRRGLPASASAAQQPHPDPSALGGTQGQASDIAIQAKEILRVKDRLNQILAYHTSNP